MRQVFILMLLLPAFVIPAQELPQTLQVQAEEFTLANESEPEDDQWVLDMEDLLRHPINLRTAGIDELQRLRVLDAIQVQSFFQYVRTLGPPENIYELQAVPGWTPGLIRKILPYIRVGVTEESDRLRQRFSEGRHELVTRTVISPEASNGFLENKFAGGPLKFFARYRYQFQNLLQWGFTLEKDPGEKWLGGKQGIAFDFLSGHILIRKWKGIESLLLGDFTVNQGQGLTQWQSISFGRGAEIAQLRRQGTAFRPYSSAGESQYMRGAAMTMRKGKWRTGIFISKKKMDANISVDIQTGERKITSLQTSGLHRTENELSDRRSAGLFSAGGHVQFLREQGAAGLNFVYHHIDKPFQRNPEPYNIFYWSGRNSGNLGIDFYHTWRNMHVFGELATDLRLNKAFVGGTMIHLDRKVDAGIVVRCLSRHYASLYGNVFSSSTQPHNEVGAYLSLTARPANGWKIDFFADLYCFPWLRYRVDKPSVGREFSLQGQYQPTKKFSMLTRFRYKATEGNSDGILPTHEVSEQQQLNWRSHFSFMAVNGIEVRVRFEQNYLLPGREEGFLFYTDWIIRPLGRKWGGSVRFAVFETGGYDSRIYAFESNVLYGFAIPAFSGRGHRYYFNADLDISRNLKAWVRWAFTQFRDRNSIGSGVDEIPGSQRSDLTLQLRLNID
jgi:hypothetical protein